MALSDLQVFSEYVYLAKTEVLAQQIDLFNAASAGCIALQSAAHQGDYSDQAIWAKISGLVRRRKAYADTSVSEKTMTQLLDTTVKVAAGTPPIRIDPGMLQWIQRSPQEAGAVIGQQLASDSMADMLNTGIGAAVAAITPVTALVNDVTAATVKGPTFANMTATVGKFGDRQNDLRVWIMHSAIANSLWQNALTNSERLFSFGTVNVISDPFGRLYLITDADNLVNSTNYYSLSLVPGAIYIGENNDFFANEETTNGYENIRKTYQAQWSYNLGLKGYTWDKTNGGKSPTSAALFTAGNWDKYATSNKDTAGVILKSLVA